MPEKDEGLVLKEIAGTLALHKHGGTKESLYPHWINAAMSDAEEILAKAKQHYHPSIEAQRLQMELAKTEERERVGKLLRDYQKTGSVWSAVLESITRQCEQALKEAQIEQRTG